MGIALSYSFKLTFDKLIGTRFEASHACFCGSANMEIMIAKELQAKRSKDRPASVSSSIYTNSEGQIRTGSCTRTCLPQPRMQREVINR
jgi:hypothetical protein